MTATINNDKRRRYLRIPTVFPIEFFCVGLNKEKTTPWIQGFTQNIGKGGICLRVNDVWQGLWDKINDPCASLSLRVHLPFMRTPLLLTARCVWLKKEAGGEFDSYLAGIEFIDAPQKFLKTLYRYAIVKRNLPRLTTIAMVIITGFFIFFWGQYHFLVRENRLLVKDYVGIVSQSAVLQQSLWEKDESREFIESRRREIQSITKILEYELAKRKVYQKDIMRNNNTGAFFDDLTDLQEEMDLLGLELRNLKKEDAFLAAKEKESKTLSDKIKKEFKELQKEKIDISKKVMAGMYKWIEHRQNFSNGLVVSYEGDRELERVCFTYDQALAAIIFLVEEESFRARKIFDFYYDKISQTGKIHNAYYYDGTTYEFVSHSGPLAWIGLAALNYIEKTGEDKYLMIAQAVDRFLDSVKDKEGGLRGGPQDLWYSTEHNLDAYAFYSKFYQVTKDKKYLAAANLIKQWISRHAYTQQMPPIKRGKGDATIATDTYSWSIASLGPENLFELKMNPEAILEFAIEHCGVQSYFNRDQGPVLVKGFDFAKLKNAARGGVISGEWTSQMILAFGVMADYFDRSDPDKSLYYLQQALFYFNELQKMIITSPSRAGREDPCLPYASKPSVDTGHGWRTPKGNRTGSLAATAYFLFAWEGYNPLTGRSLDVSMKDYYEKIFDETENKRAVKK
jgi:hypothetical protein